MLEDEATRLIARYKNTWRGGPHPDELRHHLVDMDAGTVGTVLVRLARLEEQPPSIARLWAEYRATHTTANDPLPTAPHRGCTHCGRDDDANYPSNGDGWTTAEYTHNGHTYRGVHPCTCPLGHTRESAYASVVDAHDRQRTR